MKKLIASSIVLCACALTVGGTYAYFFALPDIAQKKVIQSFSDLGFESLQYGSVKKENGHIIFSELTLDQDGFSTIKKLQVSVSLFQYLFNPHYAQRIQITGLNLTGDILDNNHIRIAGWTGKRNVQDSLKDLPAHTVTINNGKVDLLSEKMGGVAVHFDAQIRPSGDKITLSSQIRSRQKGLSFHAKTEGHIDHSGRLALTGKVDQLSYNGAHYTIHRGILDFELPDAFSLFQSRAHETSMHVKGQFSSLRWRDFPLRDVEITYDKKGRNYNLFAEGTTFGPEQIEWTHQINDVESAIKTQSTVTPETLSDLWAFIGRNKNIDKETSLPRFAKKFARPILMIETTKFPSSSLNGTYKLLVSEPDLEISGRLSQPSHNAQISGTINLPKTKYTLSSEPQEQSPYAHLKADGQFSVDLTTNAPETDINYTLDIHLIGGTIETGPIKMDIEPQIIALNDESPNPSLSSVPFTLPLKSHIRHKGHLELKPLTNESQSSVTPETIKLNIYGGSIKTMAPVSDRGKIKSQNRLLVSDINLSQLFSDARFRNIFISGQMGGVIPVKASSQHLYVDGGILQSQGGGIINLPDSITLALFPGRTQKMYMIRQALKNYHYDFFEIRLDGDLNGQVMMTLSANGYNPDFNNKEPVPLNLQIETEIKLLFKNLIK